MYKKILAAAAIACSLSGHALAASAPTQFNGTIGGTCVINVVSGGTLAVDGTLQNLNSLASPASVTVYTTSSGFNFSLDTPTLNRPVTDTTPLSSIGGAIHITGATTQNLFDTDPAYPLNSGNHFVNVYFFSSKAGPNIFTAGTYTGNTTVRCE